MKTVTSCSVVSEEDTIQVALDVLLSLSQFRLGTRTSKKRWAYTKMERSPNQAEESAELQQQQQQSEDPTPTQTQVPPGGNNNRIQQSQVQQQAPGQGHSCCLHTHPQYITPHAAQSYWGDYHYLPQSQSQVQVQQILPDQPLTVSGHNPPLTSEAGGYSGNGSNANNTITSIATTMETPSSVSSSAAYHSSSGGTGGGQYGYGGGFGTGHGNSISVVGSHGGQGHCQYGYNTGSGNGVVNGMIFQRGAGPGHLPHHPLPRIGSSFPMGPGHGIPSRVFSTAGANASNVIRTHPPSMSCGGNGMTMPPPRSIMANCIQNEGQSPAEENNNHRMQHSQGHMPVPNGHGQHHVVLPRMPWSTSPDMITYPGGLERLWREVPETCQKLMTYQDVPESARLRGYFTVSELLQLKRELIARLQNIEQENSDVKVLSAPADMNSEVGVAVKEAMKTLDDASQPPPPSPEEELPRLPRRKKIKTEVPVSD